MSVDTGHAQVIARIGFAERWLHRAKAQCADGDVVGGLMTLSLADAEMRVALETGGWSRHRPSAPRPAMRRWLPWVMVAAAASLASVWTFRPAAVPADAAVVDGPAVVRFSSHVGAVLSLISVTPAPRAPVQFARPNVRPRGQRSTPQAPPRATAAPLRPPAAAAAPTVTPAVTPAARPTITAPVSAPVLSPAAPFVLSEVDLIDMVLAANQALRGTGP
jgi:hypothetical protein